MSADTKKNRVKNPETKSGSKINENPDDIFAQNIQDIEKVLSALFQHYQTRYDNVERFLQKNEPNIYKEIERVFHIVDCDIYNKFAEGSLLPEELEEWKKSISHLKKLFITGIQKFTFKQFGKMLDIDSLSLVQAV